MSGEFNKGPDQIAPAISLCTTKADGHVRLRIPRTGIAIETVAPISVPGLLEKVAYKNPSNVALCFKKDGAWASYTYGDYLNEVRTCAKAFLELGLERYHSVCILGFNSPEWFIADLGAIFAGGVAVGVYTTNSPEACLHCAQTSRANIIVVQDDLQLQKILTIKDQLPQLKALIQYKGEPTQPGVLSWSDLMQIGREQNDRELNKVLNTVSINECCTLVYTSGTVGKPKAVMLSHDNLTWDALAISERLQLKQGSEVIISYLPLSHVAAQVVDIFIAMTNVATVYFAEPDALKGSLLKTMQEVRPTRFLGVPRVWEKIYEKMMEVAAQGSYFRKLIASWAKAQTYQYYVSKMNGGNSRSLGYTIASHLIFKRVKLAMGFDRCKLFASAAAPLSPDIKKYFMSIDLPIMEAFGMSEASGAHTLGTDDQFGINTVGTTIPGMTTKIHNPDETGNGEICMYGRHVFMGYLEDVENTKTSLDEEGWLHSGDLGRVDEKGFVFVTGRLKELIITAGGENVPPVPIEHAVLKELPFVSHAVLVGDKKKFLSVLLALKTVVDPETGVPTDELTKEVKMWLKGIGSPAKTVTELLNSMPNTKVMEAIQKGIDRANMRAVSNAQKIQKFALLPKDFSVATGELGPTMKVKRNVVAAKYEELINNFYKQ